MFGLLPRSASSLAVNVVSTAGSRKFGSANPCAVTITSWSLGEGGPPARETSGAGSGTFGGVRAKSRARFWHWAAGRRCPPVQAPLSRSVRAFAKGTEARRNGNSSVPRYWARIVPPAAVIRTLHTLLACIGCTSLFSSRAIARESAFSNVRGARWDGQRERRVGLQVVLCGTTRMSSGTRYRTSDTRRAHRVSQSRDRDVATLTQNGTMLGTEHCLPRRECVVRSYQALL